MAKEVSLPNGRSWKTQTKALTHFKEMLGRYADEQVIDDASDHQDLLTLLERYDLAIADGPSKIGAGVDCFLRRRNVGPDYSTPGFWVRRIDGSETDFSYINAVKGKPKTDAQQFYDACRAAIASDLKAAKRRHFDTYGDDQGRVECEISSDLVGFDQAHIDHAYPTFGQLVISFRAARGWQHGVPAGTLTAPMDRQTTTTFADAAIAQAFNQFHHAAVTLRVVSAGRNLATAAKQRRPKVKRPVIL